MLNNCHLERRLVFETMRFGYRLTSQPPVPCVDAANKCVLFFTRALKPEVGK